MDEKSEVQAEISTAVVSDMHSDIKDIKKEGEHTEEVVEAISERK
jgi:hypothetical protein